MFMCSLPFLDRLYYCLLRLRAVGCAIWLLLLVPIANVYASENDDFTDRLKVAFTYKIIQFIEWTGDAGGESKGPVNLCVLSGNQLDRLFADFDGKAVNGRAVQVAFLNQLPKSSGQCDVLYIGHAEQIRLPQILQHVESIGKILTVSDIEQFAKSGGMVAFKANERSVKMEINVSSATNSGIKISSKLLEVANIVERD